MKEIFDKMEGKGFYYYSQGHLYMGEMKMIKKMEKEQCIGRM